MCASDTVRVNQELRPWSTNRAAIRGHVTSRDVTRCIVPKARDNKPRRSVRAFNPHPPLHRALEAVFQRDIHHSAFFSPLEWLDVGRWLHTPRDRAEDAMTQRIVHALDELSIRLSLGKLHLHRAAIFSSNSSLSAASTSPSKKHFKLKAVNSFKPISTTLLCSSSLPAGSASV